MVNRHHYKHTLGIDPSGAYDEGKGTTGWCVMDNDSFKLVTFGNIRASKYPSAMEYFKAHLDLILHFHNIYEDLAVSIEDYVLYKTQALAQVNSHLETVQLLGVIKYACFLNDIHIAIRPAVRVKARWTDTILVHKQLLVCMGKHYYAVVGNTPFVTCEHERDAIRHAAQFCAFENGVKQ